MKRNRSDRFFRKNTEPSAVFSVGAAGSWPASVAGCFAAARGWAGQIPALWQELLRWSASGFVPLFAAQCLLALGDCAVLWLLGRAAAGLLLAPAAVFARGFLITLLGASRIWETGGRVCWPACVRRGRRSCFLFRVLLVLATLCCAAGGKRGAFARLYQKCEKSVRALVAWSVLGCAAQERLGALLLACTLVTQLGYTKEMRKDEKR